MLATKYENMDMILLSNLNPYCFFLQTTATRLFEIERELKQEVTCWQTEKKKRLTDLKELTTIEQSLCDIMHATPLYIPSGSVPTREQIDKLRHHTDTLAKEKVCC